MNTCIYTTPKSGGVRCTFAQVHNTLYCSSHKRFGNVSSLFKNIDIFLQGDSVYSCCEIFWNSRDLEGFSFAHRINLLFDAIDILCYVYDHQGIEELYKSAKLRLLSKSKKTAAQQLAMIMWKTYLFSKNSKAMAGLVKLQQRFRKSYTTTVNTVDPFTMEAIKPENYFRFKESGRYYAFNGIQLFKAVFWHGNKKNPFTNVDIPKDTLARLKTWGNERGINIRREDRTTWNSVMQAWTDFSVTLEQYVGIFAQPEWFIHYSADEIMYIFRNFHRCLPGVSDFMNRQEEAEAYASLDVDDSHYALVKEAIRLVKARNVINHIQQVCCLCIVLAQMSFHFSRSLPEWVIDTPLARTF